MVNEEANCRQPDRNVKYIPVLALSVYYFFQESIPLNFANKFAKYLGWK